MPLHPWRSIAIPHKDVLEGLWKSDNQDLMILPGSLPLADAGTRNELTYYLSAGWDPVIERDIDGERAETTELESRARRASVTSGCCVRCKTRRATCRP